MRPAAQIQATIELFTEINKQAIPADRYIATFFRQRRYIGSKDKRAISEYLYTLLRNKLSFSYMLEQANAKASPRLLCAVLLKRNNKNWHDYFNGEQYSPAMLDSEEERAINTIDFATLDTAPLHIQYNLPEWMLDKFIAVFANRFKTEMQALNQRASTDIRVNTLSNSRENVLQQLQQAGLPVEITPVSPWGLRFTDRVSLLNQALYKQGHFDIQDEGSQLLALVTGAKPKHMVIDYCAGAGGKTLAMAAMMHNQGHIAACDIHASRLKELSHRCQRAEVTIADTHTLNAHNNKWQTKHKASADIVLIDAPCSGTGTWRRSPDSRWHLTSDAFNTLLATQQDILQQASKLVKTGGQIFYATCSVLLEENEQQIEQFLSQNPDFALGELSALDLLKQHQDKLDFTNSQLRTYPERSNMDGFFICALKRKHSQQP